MPPSTATVRAALEAAPTWFRPAVLLGAGAGLRQAEASGLTADRIDWLGRTIRVDRQWLSRSAAFGPPKTASSIRTIPVSDALLAELGHLVGRRHGGFVVTRDDEATSSNLFAYTWRAITKAAGLDPALRFHHLRHAYASALIAEGCSVKAVQRALGHGSATTTLNTYAHLWPGDDDRIRRAADTFLVPTEDSLRTARPSSA